MGEITQRYATCNVCVVIDVENVDLQINIIGDLLQPITMVRHQLQTETLVWNLAVTVGMYHD